RLASIKHTNRRLFTAYLLKEQLRAVFEAKGTHGRALLAGWLAWARRSRLPEFTKLAKTMTHYLPLLRNTLDHGLSNARSESTNTPPPLAPPPPPPLPPPPALIAMARLPPGGLCPPYPAGQPDYPPRNTTTRRAAGPPPAAQTEDRSAYGALPFQAASLPTPGL